MSVAIDMQRARLAGIDFPPAVLQDGDSSPYSFTIIEDLVSDRSGLQRLLVVDDQAPAQCCECGKDLLGGGFVDMTDWTAEDYEQYELNEDPTRRSCRPCPDHFGAGVLWPPKVEIRYQPGELAASIAITQAGFATSPTALHLDTLPHLALALARIHEWAERMDAIALDNADRDRGDEHAPAPSDFENAMRRCQSLSDRWRE